MGFIFESVTPMMLGAIAMASGGVSLIFLKHWRTTKDKFFLLFALSFAVEAVTRIFQALVALESEHEPLIYVTRLVSYGLILLAIADKNRKRT